MEKVPIKWESVDVTPQLKNGKTVIPDEAIDSVTRNYVALKGPLAVRPHVNLHFQYTSADQCRHLSARATSRST